ncbi:hypothetical protein DSCO28_14550 [Desulfosarcina ovata subsp. sediminis]|uniref:Uncharacterized protein n=1 Tax=Desulfosarcina ovata subsp. sediminis TaxID=885957 RepID=A0A5K7ZMP4_9BACT|nr:hypothetical protein DSCO28_14550 [Desulfosarcina ovata subsp. sediminis]
MVVYDHCRGLDVIRLPKMRAGSNREKNEMNIFGLSGRIPEDQEVMTGGAGNNKQMPYQMAIRHS